MIRNIPLILVAGLLAEIASLVVVGRWIGVVPVLLLVIGGAASGGVLIRTGGMSIAVALRQPPRPVAGQPNQAFAGVFRVFAGLLLIVPGFISDAAGLCLLLPPVQRWIVGIIDGVFGARQRSAGPIIDAEAVEIEGQSTDISSPEGGRNRLER